MDTIDQGFHVSIAMRELLGVDGPIAIVVLPTIVQGNPGETHFLDGRKRVVHLLELYRAAITPGTPDRAKRAVGRRGHLKSLPHHEAAVFRERAKVVPLMHRDKCAKSMEALFRLERSLLIRADGHVRMTRIRHGNGKRYKARSRLDMAYCETNVLTPYVDNGSASTVVTGIHAKIIFLPEAGSQGKNPIGTLLVRATLIGPERRPSRGGK